MTKYKHKLLLIEYMFQVDCFGVFFLGPFK